VDKVDAAVTQIEKIAKENGGDLFSSNFFQNSQAQKSGTLSVKVPVANFEKTFTALKTVASAVVRESTSGQDVTQQYQDLNAQIKNKQAEEAAYQKILDQAQKISDVIDVTQALSRVRGEIESLQVQLNYLTNQTDLSTIYRHAVGKTRAITVTDSWRPLQVAKESYSLACGQSARFCRLCDLFSSLLSFRHFCSICSWPGWSISLAEASLKNLPKRKLNSNPFYPQSCEIKKVDGGKTTNNQTKKQFGLVCWISFSKLVFALK